MMQIILIPAYKPDEKFIKFAKELLAAGCTVVSVDDGSGEDCRPYFTQAEELGVYVVTHSENKGKGAALKTGISYIMKKFPGSGVITADCDGQHTVKDILRVSRKMEKYPDKLILGGRFSSMENVPLRSAFGNTFTRIVFKAATGLSIRDTQTGLRGLPAGYLENMLQVKGDRYEYEMNVLLKLKEWGLDFKEISIETIYIEENKSSHYNPLKDSWRILKQIIKFCTSSVFCFTLDYVLFFTFDKLFAGDSGLAYVCARLISGTANYLLNSKLVFKQGGAKTALKYFLTAVLVATTGSLFTGLFKELFRLPSVLCKILIDLPLFVVNFYLQREFVFRKKPSDSKEV